jgi:hypothetical protein
MYISPEEDAVLYRVDQPPLACGESDPTAEIMVVPILFVCKREDMRSLETSPYPEFDIRIFCLSYNTTSISLAHLISEFPDPCSRTKRYGPGDDHIVVDIHGTISDDKIVAGEERL